MADYKRVNDTLKTPIEAKSALRTKTVRTFISSDERFIKMYNLLSYDLNPINSVSFDQYNVNILAEYDS